MSVTLPMPSQRGHMPPSRVKVAFSVFVLAPRSTVIAPLPRTEGTLNEYALGEPICGFPSRLKRMRSSALASVAVPTVERGLAPIRSWSTMIAVVSPSSTSTSGRASVGMKPCTKALYVSLISRCDSAAIVSNTRELLPEPETPVNTVSRRFGSSTLTSWRLFTRAPCTRIRSWLSATYSAGDFGSVLVAMLIVSPSVRRGRLRGLSASPGLIQPASSSASGLLRFGPGASRHSRVLKQPEDVAIGVGDGGHQAAPTYVARGFLHGGTRGGHLGQLRLDVRHVPVGHRRGHALRSTARHQPDVLARGLEADVVGPVGRRRHAEQGSVHGLCRLQVGHGMQHGLDPLGGSVAHGHS